jgi:hypothetical protein
VGVSHYGLAIYMKKYLQAKEELWKLKYFHHTHTHTHTHTHRDRYIYNLQKNPIKETKILHDIINSVTNLSSFNTSQNIYHLSKTLI